MSIDFNNEEEQRQSVNGPVPGGSKVMVRISIEKPKHPSREHEFVSEAKGGLLGLWCKFEVCAGEYEGVKFYDNLWLPKGQQRITLTEGQTKACNMSGAKIRAIIEAARGISPKDASPAASRKRNISDWLDLSGMEFPALLGISTESYQGKDGKEYWGNNIMRVITPDREDYSPVVNGNEYICENGPVIGTAKKKNNSGGYGLDSYEPPFPHEDSSFDDQPF